MLSLAERSTEPEELDVGVPDDEARRSLADLRFVNRWLGGRRALCDAVRPYLAPGGRLLDVGCGSADMPAEILRQGPAPLLAVGVDIKLLHLREAPAEIAPVVADVHRLPFAPRSFDVVTASLFLHHFDGDQVAEVLRTLHALCRGALVINDLHRAFVPYAFGRLAFPFILRSRVSRADGLLSIRRAFRPAELRDAFAQAGIERVRLARRFPYRIVAVAEA